MTGLGQYSIGAPRGMGVRIQPRATLNITVFLIKSIMQPDSLNATKEIQIYLSTGQDSITIYNIIQMQVAVVAIYI